MSEPCPLCGREKLKDRVQRSPRMTEDPSMYCLHPSHIYGKELPPCERRGIERIDRMRLVLGALRGWCERGGHDYALRLVLHGLGEGEQPEESP